MLLTNKVLHSLRLPERHRSKESICNAGDPSSTPWSGRPAGAGIGYPLQYSWVPWVCRDLGLIYGLGRSPGGGVSNPLQYSCLENPHGQRSLAVYSLWGRKELGTTEQVSIAQCNKKTPSKLSLLWEDLEASV